MQLIAKLSTSLKAKFLFFSLSIFLLLFLGTGLLNYFSKKEQLNSQMSVQIELAQVRAETVLPALIWNFAEESIKDFTNAELKNEFITAIVISDGANVIYSAKTNSKNIIFQQDFDPFKNHSSAIEFPLIFTEGGIDNRVGFAQILINHQLVESTLKDILIKQILESITYCAVLFALIWRLTSTLVLTPLLELNNHLKLMTDTITKR